MYFCIVKVKQKRDIWHFINKEHVWLTNVIWLAKMAVTSGIGSFFLYCNRLFYQIMLLEHCVMAAPEILVLLVQVRILVFQQICEVVKAVYHISLISWNRWFESSPRNKHAKIGSYQSGQMGFVVNRVIVLYNLRWFESSAPNNELRIVGVV